MKILLLGDSHTYGYGLPARQLSYTGHFVRQLSRAGRAVTVEAYAHLSLPESTALLARLPLHHYDLIVLQLGSDIIRRRMPGSTAGRAVAGPVLPRLQFTAQNSQPGPSRMLKRAGMMARTLMNVAASMVSALWCPTGLTQLLTLLRPHRHTVLLMTPFPCQMPLEQLARQRSRSLLMKIAGSQLFSIFDTQAVARPRDEHFLTGSPEYLNGVSHELIGQALFEFYQSAPTIITVQTSNKNQSPT